MAFNWKESIYVVEKSATLEDAMATITGNRRGALVVVDEDGTLVGIVSDGDIRRAMLRGATMRTPIEKAVNMNVVSLPPGSEKEAADIFEKKQGVNLLPIADKKNHLVNVIVRES